GRCAYRTARFPRSQDSRTHRENHMAIVTLADVTKTYPPASKGDALVTAVDGVSLDIEAGDIFGIIGYSGAGQSTLVRRIHALEPGSARTTTVDGVDITALSERALRRVRGGIGMIFQQFTQFSSKTVRANIAYPLRLAGWSRA